MKISAILLITSITAAAAPPPSKMAPDTPGSGKVDVIIVFRQPPTETQHEKVRHLGGTLKSVLSSVQAGVYTVPAEILKTLAADPDVVHVSPDRPVRSTLEYAEPTVNADKAFQYGFNGSGVGV